MKRKSFAAPVRRACAHNGSLASMGILCVRLCWWLCFGWAQRLQIFTKAFSASPQFVRSSASVCVFLCVRALANTARMGQLSHTNLCVLWVSLVRSFARSALWQPAQTHTRGQVFARASLGVAAARNSTGKLASTFQRQAADNNDDDDDCCSSAAALRIVFPRARGRLARTFVVVGGGAEIRRPRRVVCGMCARAPRTMCEPRCCLATWRPLIGWLLASLSRLANLAEIIYGLLAALAAFVASAATLMKLANVIC